MKATKPETKLNTSDVFEAEDTPTNEVIEPEFVESDYYEFFNDQVEKDMEFIIRLYRYPGKGRRKLTWLDTYEGYVPRRSEIALEHGSGHYYLVGRRRYSQTQHNRHLHIDPIWDKRKEEHDRKKLSISGGAPNTVEDSLRLAERIMAMMKSLQPAQTNTTDKSLETAIKGVRDMQVKLLEDSIRERKSLYNEIKDMFNQQDENQVLEDDKEPNPIVQELYEIISQWGKQFLESTGIVKNKITTKIQSNEKFQQLINNPDWIDQLYQMCCDNPKIGEDEINKIFKNLGVQVDEE